MIKKKVVIPDDFPVGSPRKGLSKETEERLLDMEAEVLLEMQRRGMLLPATHKKKKSVAN